ncbi:MULTISPECIES: site-specific integrase [Rhizobium/Agrobacterium group]|uniref:Phage-related integrase n=1 Tax=Allorhizobium ampelinum (strain ATCC BAA-846 / DSM 112012 / S4) TaxID=311402 RepID=B9JSD0_ALLAM|nr:MULTISPECIES: site-specific integrase [Rhizobium/Agrobacterium group]ACM35623.1 phage-related integrase [Allorhizobium ampelinum S4]
MYGSGIVRVKLKGLNKVKKKLADGTPVTYFYAWKGGPPLPGKPGDPEFMAAYNAAISRKVEPQAGTLQSILNAFQVSSDWDDLAPRTKSDYVKLIKVIEKEFGTFPISGLKNRRAKSIFLSWRDERARASRRQADYGWQVLARILSWALGRGLIEANPCEKGGRLYQGSRAEFVWTGDDEANFLASAPPHLHLALILALWTGQRQGDLLALTWPQYDGERIRLKQGKTGARVVIPVGGPLKAMLDPIRQKVGHVLLTLDGTPWTSGGFSSSWRKACAAAGVVGVTFNDLRGTAVTRLALAGCTEAEIATISGHSLRDVRSILDSNYLNRDPELGENAIRKLEGRTKFPN